MADESRSEQIATLLTPSEATAVRRLADIDRRTVSDWVRIILQDRIALASRPLVEEEA